MYLCYSTNHIEGLPFLSSCLPGWAHSAPDTYIQWGCDRRHKTGHHAGTPPLLLFEVDFFTNIPWVCQCCHNFSLQDLSEKADEWHNKNSQCYKVKKFIILLKKKRMTAIIQFLCYFVIYLRWRQIDRDVTDVSWIRCIFLDTFMASVQHWVRSG